MPSNAPKDKLHMSLISKRLVGMVASTALLSLVSAAANAQVFSNEYGSWYTDQALWQSLVTNVSTAEYTATGNRLSPYTQNGVTAVSSAFFTNSAGKLTSPASKTITFSFSGNAFGGMFGISQSGSLVRETGSFVINSTLTNSQSITTSASNYSFFGYISNSSSPITVVFRGVADRNLSVDSFSFGNGTNSLAGGNVAPEPGSFALALTGGAALIGICIRRRRNAG